MTEQQIADFHAAKDAIERTDVEITIEVSAERFVASEVAFRELHEDGVIAADTALRLQEVGLDADNLTTFWDENVSLVENIVNHAKDL